MDNQILRKECYVLNPSRYEISCDKCQGTHIEWSEYEGLIWCYDCKIDTRGNEGIFSGPIPLEAAKLLLGKGCFDKVNLETGEIIERK